MLESASGGRISTKHSNDDEAPQKRRFQKLAVDSTQNPHVVIGARGGTYNTVVLVHHLYELAYY
jgi:hypothetical protein